MIKLKNSVQIPENAVQLQTTVSLDGGVVPAPIFVMQYDQTLPVAAVKLIFMQQPYSIPSGAELNVRFKKPDGHGVYNPCLGSDENGVVYFAFTQQMTAAPGDGMASIEITLDGVKSSIPFSVKIIENPVQDGKIESADEFLTLQEILAEAKKWGKIVQDNAANIQTAVDNIESIKGAPAAASRAEQAEANAKKYANMAQQVSQGAVGFYENEAALKQAHPTGENGNWAIVGDTDSIWVWDNDSGTWLDTKTNIKLSEYYTKTESDNRFLGKQAKAADAEKLGGKTLSSLQDLIAPVGYVFEWAPVSGQSIDLSTAQKVAAYFGFGTWAEYGKGRVAVGVDASQTEFATPGKTGGEKIHVLKESELPSITVSPAGGGAWLTVGGSASEITDGIAHPGTAWAGEKIGRTTGKPFGSGQGHNNLQPYITVYRWQRIK